MSRAALRIQEGNAYEREQRAYEMFQLVCTEGQCRPNTVPIWGSSSHTDDNNNNNTTTTPTTTTFHWNTLLLHNTIHSTYFQKCCETLKDWNSIIDEIYYEVDNLLVFQGTTTTTTSSSNSSNKKGGRHPHHTSTTAQTPSTAFCLLLRLLALRMTTHQLELTLQHPDSPYIRAIGFLYVRYVGQPEHIWQYIEPYLFDEEIFTIEKAQTRNAKPITMGEFVRQIFQSRNYYHGDTTFPRWPLSMEREIQVKILAANEIALRAQQHWSSTKRMEDFRTIGTKIMALYGDEENPVTWYEAEIDRVIASDHPGGMPKFVVTFPEYGNTETVLLGEIDVLDRDKTTKYKDNGGIDGTHRDLYKEVQQRERDRVVTSDKGQWGRRPPTTKMSLSSGGGGGGRHHENYPHRRRNDDRNPNNMNERLPNIQHRPTMPPTNIITEERSFNANAPATSSSSSSSSSPKKRTNAEMAIIAERKRKLMARYG